jgi:hypothetical protein
MYCIDVLTFVQRRPKNCAVLIYYAASSGNFLPTFRYNLSLPYSSVKHPKRRTVKPSKAKEPNKGEEFLEAQVDIHFYIWLYLRLIASIPSSWPSWNVAQLVRMKSAVRGLYKGKTIPPSGK